MRKKFATIIEQSLTDQLKVEAVMTHQTIADTLEQILKEHFKDRLTHSSHD